MAKIVALVTSLKEEVAGGAPIFIVQDRLELERNAHLLEKLLDCSAHQISETLFLLVDRHPGGSS
jgi:hypothetical protein